MPSPGDNLPIIRKGNPILATDIQRIADAAGRKSLLPGMMQTGAYTVQKKTRVAEDVRVQEVAIIENIDASAWNKTTKKKTRVVATSPVFHPHTDGDDSDTIDPDTTITYTSNLKVAITITEGMFKRGIVIGGKLIQVQCEEEELPDDWEGSS